MGQRREPTCRTGNETTTRKLSKRCEANRRSTHRQASGRLFCAKQIAVLISEAPANFGP